MEDEVKPMWPQWVGWLIMVLCSGFAIALTALWLSGCSPVFRIFDPNSGRVVKEYRGEAATTISETEAKLMRDNQKLNATAQQTTTWFCRTLYGVGVLFIIGGVIVAWIYSKRTGIGLSLTGLAIFILARMLQSYLIIISIGVLIVLLLMAAWYVYKYHDTILKVADIQIKEIK
jgi:hypothetical protein